MTFTAKDAMALRFGTDHPVERPRVRLSGTDGNAFAIIAKVRSALTAAGRSPEEVERFTREATEGDYDHLLQVACRWCEVS